MKPPQKKNQSPQADKSSEAASESEARGIENDITFPSREILAVMAAIVGRGQSADAASAVDYAYNLWEQAGEKLKQEEQQPFSLEGNLELLAQEAEGLQHPKKYPAPFTEFLKLIVRGKTVADSTKRFRDFLKSTSNEQAADARMARCRKAGFADTASWSTMAREYRDWWRVEKSNKARLAAKKRKKK